MKKVFLLVTTFLLLTISSAFAGIIDHPSYAKIVTLTSSFVEQVITAQADYFIVNGHFFQGIRLVPGEPNGTDNVGADATKKPTDQADTWNDFAPLVFKNNLKIPFQVRINTSADTLGYGWEMVIEVWKDGLGPDQFGNYGDNWRYRHYEGPVTPSGHLDVWFIVPESDM